MISDDTIAAVSSATGPAARMIVRLSGPEACNIASALCRTLPAGANAAARLSLSFRGLQVPAWAYVFRAPHGYTGEDLVELHVPGNPVLARMLLEELLLRGARPAEAGEFTARAYFNGRLDLTEAEGVAATIAAGNEAELGAARQLLAGELARRLRPAMDAVAGTLALVEVGIDFTDEDVSFLSCDEVGRRIESAHAALRELLAHSSRFDKLAHEPQLVLAGRPNAGKSTLLNALAGRARAVTSPTAGTTRDVLTAEVVLRRGMVRLTDVAGIDDASADAADGAKDAEVATTDSPDGPMAVPSGLVDVERQMRERAMRVLESADQVILVHDASDPRPPLRLPRPPDLIVRSKADLLAGLPVSCGPEAVPRSPDAGRSHCVSALTGENLDSLTQALDDLAFGGLVAAPTLALNARHVRSIDRALDALTRAVHLTRGGTPELLALELREALDDLGQILGQVSPDDLLGRIFSAFCIGK